MPVKSMRRYGVWLVAVRTRSEVMQAASNANEEVLQTPTFQIQLGPT
jgi:hypothetical protein